MKPTTRLTTESDVYEELVYLCEIRGELDPESNAKTEAKIAELNKQLKEMQCLAHKRPVKLV